MWRIFLHWFRLVAGVVQKPPWQGPPTADFYIRIFSVLPLALAFLVAVFLGYRELFSWDLGYHLSAGRWMEQNSSFIFRDTFTFTLSDAPYIDMHWLYQVMVWELFSSGGSLAVVAGHLCIHLACLATLVLRSLRRDGGGTLIQAMVLLVFILGNTWEPRPYAVTWLLLSITLLILEEHTRRPGPWIWLLPGIIMFWVNIQSLYAVGMAVIGAYAGMEALRGKRADRRLLSAALLCVPACLVNPYGWDGLFYPFLQWDMIRSGSVFTSASGIYEFMSPLSLAVYGADIPHFFYHPHVHVHVALVLAFLCIPFFWRHTNSKERLVFVLLLYLFLEARRNHGLFMVAAYPLLVLGAKRFLDIAFRWWVHWQESSFRMAVVLVRGVSCLVAVVLLVHVYNGYFYASHHSQDRMGHSFNRNYLPVGAAEFLTRSDIPDGRMLNALHDGGYLGFATGRRVYVDGRLEVGGPDFYLHCMSLVNPECLGTAVRERDLQMAVIPHGDIPVWLTLFAANSAWRCIFLDSYSAVFFRSDFAPHVPDIRYSKSARTPVPEESIRAVLAAAAWRKDPGFLASLRGRYEYPADAIRLCAAFRCLGMPDAVIEIGLDALQETRMNAPELFMELESAFRVTGRLCEAHQCARILHAGKCAEAMLRF